MRIALLGLAKFSKNGRQAKVWRNRRHPIRSRAVCQCKNHTYVKYVSGRQLLANSRLEAFNDPAMSALLKLHFTPEEYLALEDQAEYKSEYVYGEIFAMAGTQPAHNQIVGALIRALGRRFEGRACDTFFMDIRLRAAEGNMYTYPDVMALCGQPQFDGRGEPGLPSLLNPQVIFEVLSPSTEAFDRGEKFRGYRRIETLTDYILVSAERMRVEQHIRQPNGVWTRKERVGPEGILRLDSIDCDLPLAEIYDKVVLTNQ